MDQYPRRDFAPFAGGLQCLNNQLADIYK